MSEPHMSVSRRVMWGLAFAVVIAVVMLARDWIPLWIAYVVVGLMVLSILGLAVGGAVDRSDRAQLEEGDAAVLLLRVGPRPIEVLKIVREATDRVSHVADLEHQSYPMALVERVSERSAARMVERLRSAGAEADVA